ncbi:MAG TPA: TraB/GumN family protein [Gammaproteobacteria bacterium]|nr:TraB/GumN family protein [Gammaproteobacteria bacterium]
MRWCLILMVLYAAPGFAETSLWRISKGANELFMGGTIHVLSKTDYPLPAAFDAAYKKSAKLVFETDIDASQAPTFAQAMLQRMMLPDDRTLKDTLRPDVYAQLEKFGTTRGIPMVMLEKMRPAMAVITLTFMELQRLGMAGEGVDNYYYQRAKTDKKTLGHLESNEQQLDFMTNMGKGRENDFVLYSLKDLQDIADIMQSLKRAWRNGNSAEMEALSLVSMRQDFPQIYQQLLVERNQRWLPRIESMLNDPGTEMVLVGALHLVGEDGVLHALRKKGYRIEQW